MQNKINGHYIVKILYCLPFHAGKEYIEFNIHPQNFTNGTKKPQIF